MSAKTKNAPKIAAIICLYGTHEIGAGWLASIKRNATLNTSLGTGEPNPNLGFTGAVWAAKDALAENGVKHNDTVRIFAAGGLFYADAKLGRIGYYGDLTFKTVHPESPL